MSDKPRAKTGDSETARLDAAPAIVVTGDVTIDWNLGRRAPHRVAGGWHSGLQARATRQYGAAALLAELVEGALARSDVGEPKPALLGMDLATNRLTPDDERFAHSYAVWVPCEARRGERRTVWRVDPPMGLDPARSEDHARAEWARVAREAPSANVIAIDDQALGFRQLSDPDLWRQVGEGGNEQWVLLKAARPVTEGPLWNHVLEHCADRLVVLTTIDDLRSTAVQVSRELSWERTAQDLYWELVHNPLINALSLCAHVVVSFGVAGAMLLSRDGSGSAHCELLFDPEVVEGMWEAERPGEMTGEAACLAAAVVSELALHGERPDLAKAIGRGLAAGRRLWDSGYGETARGMDLEFPTAAVVEELTGEAGSLQQAAVQDPSAFLPRTAPTAGREDGRPPVEHGFWTILEDRYAGDLRGVAADVALRGPEVALEGVPLGRFGKLLTVDRGEIESFRGLRALIAEYCRSSESKPLSIGVFGAPGSGKSFGIVQVAQSLGLDQISGKIEFNLSQFGSVADLHDALHQVRDIGLSGAIPLVFWDEFDATFQGTELGWLRYFLAPMQDGAFRQGQLLHPVGRAIFVFAGGTSDRMERFGENVEPQAFRSLKCPDFISRLKGYVNVLGPNPREGETDPHHVIRRAILLRSILGRSHPQLIDDEGILQIDPGVLRAFLEIGAYRHGARSLEAIIATSRLAGETSYQRSSLPPEAQLDLHVDGRGFLALVQQLELEGEPLEQLAQAMHEIYCEDLGGYGPGASGARVPWSELPERLKQQNREAVRDIPEKLERIDHVMIPARSHEVPPDFPAERLEELAKYEHDRYVEARLADGWSYGSERDERKKTNPTLVPWEELSETERDKDRSQVQGIPRILARTGYTVVSRSHDPDG